MIVLRGQPARSRAPMVLNYSRCVVLGFGPAKLGTTWIIQQQSTSNFHWYQSWRVEIEEESKWLKIASQHQGSILQVFGVSTKLRKVFASWRFWRVHVQPRGVYRENWLCPVQTYDGLCRWLGKYCFNCERYIDGYCYCFECRKGSMIIQQTRKQNKKNQ